MKKQEAVEILKGDFSRIVLGENESHSDAFAKAFNMAIEALEKQVAKTPIKEERELHNRHSVTVAVCPNCKHENTMGIYDWAKTAFKHCPDCGQKIDWSTK